MKKVITAILLGSIVFSGCKSDQKKKKDILSDFKKIAEENPGINAGTGTYFIAAPEGWTKRDTGMSGINLTSITSPMEGRADIFKENVNVITEKVKGYSLDEYADANRKNMAAEYSDLKFLEHGKITIGNIPAEWFIYTLNYSGYPLKNVMYVLVKNDIGYVITCSSLKPEFEKYQPTFKSCVNSFTIND